jgi:hypothetical protein
MLQSLVGTMSTVFLLLLSVVTVGIDDQKQVFKTSSPTELPTFNLVVSLRFLIFPTL